jgi:hypothetical protein
MSDMLENINSNLGIVQNINSNLNTCAQNINSYTQQNIGNNLLSSYQKLSSKLQYLNYIIYFEIDSNNILKDNIKSIKKNKFTFKCDFIGNKIQPYEFIMNLIEKEITFSVNIKVSDILTICYSGLKFIEIENNLNFDDLCDFSLLVVKFKYEKIKYENHKLSKKELRTEKIKKINLI